MQTGRSARYGVLGGTFDPVHNGHLALAQAALEQLSLTEVILVPNSRSPLKSDEAAPCADRLAMCQLAAASHPQFSVSDIECVRGGKSFAVQTVAELQLAKPGDYWFILGTDALRTFPEWRQPSRLIRLSRLAVVGRDGLGVRTVAAGMDEDIQEAVDEIQLPPKRISSSKIREDIRLGKSAELWMPSDVWNYIINHGLYKEQ